MQVVVRALRILNCLGREPRGLTMGEIGERLELAGATAHRMLAVLEAEQYVTRSSTTRKYFLGPAALELHEGAPLRNAPMFTGHPALAEAARSSGETVFLNEWTHGKVICVALEESEKPLRLFVRVGQSMPLHAAASARVLLAWRDEEEVLSALRSAGLSRYTPDTPSTVDGVLKRLQDIRDRGYDICSAELDENVWAVSAPVRTAAGVVVASVTLAAPESRVGDQQARDGFVKLVLEAAYRMSTELGWTEASPF
jgi:DNA-binding IclR family transcriptional regulator